jgi:hypothetical protein
MTISTPVIEDLLNIDPEFEIIWITRISDQFFIYATNWVNSRQYAWNWIDDTVDRIITWVDKPILNVANFANIDYVIVWTDKRQGLYLVNWYQLDPIIVTDDYIDQSDRIFFSWESINNIETIWNKLLIAWYNWVYSYGKRTPWLPNALIKQFLHNGCWGVTNIFYNEWLSYSIFAYFYWTIWDSSQNPTTGNHKIQFYLPDWTWSEEFLNLVYCLSGWIETQSIIWETYSNTKNTQKITIGAKIFQYTQINVYQEDTYYANLYIKWIWYSFVVWDTYTYNSRTYTILNIINPKSTASWYILHCSYAWDELSWEVCWSFTKWTWDWPSSLYVERVRYWYKLLWQITDTTEKKHTINAESRWNKTKYAIELVNNTASVTPKLYDFNLYFEEIADD